MSFHSLPFPEPHSRGGGEISVTLFFCCVFLQHKNSEIWDNRSSFQLGQTGGRSGQTIIKSQMKHSLTHGSCRFHNCRNVNTFLTSHRELAPGACIWVFVLRRKKHAVVKSHQSETRLSAEFIGDRTRSSLSRSPLTKTKPITQKYREFCTCHTLQERDLNTAPLTGH